MIDPGSAASLLSSFKALSDMAGALVGVRDATVIQQKVFELQREIVAAQNGAMQAQLNGLAMVERVRELEAKLAAAEGWAAEKARYQLKDFGGGTFAYELRPDAANGEPSHLICPTCFAKGAKSILQFVGNDAGGRRMQRCDGCKSQLDLGVANYRDFGNTVMDSSGDWISR